VNLFFVIIIALLFFSLSYLAIYPEDIIENYIKRKYGEVKWVGNITSFMSYLIILIVTSIITYFIFNIHLNVFFLAVYIFIIEKISMLIYTKSGSKVIEHKKGEHLLP